MSRITYREGAVGVPQVEPVTEPAADAVTASTEHRAPEQSTEPVTKAGKSEKEPRA